MRIESSSGGWPPDRVVLADEDGFVQAEDGGSSPLPTISGAVRPTLDARHHSEGSKKESGMNINVGGLAPQLPVEAYLKDELEPVEFALPSGGEWLVLF